MQRYIFYISFLFCFSFFFNLEANATSGACSYHDGVDSSAGPDWDGSVICSDGWRDSSVLYSEMKMCKSEATALDIALKVTKDAMEGYLAGSCTSIETSLSFLNDLILQATDQIEMFKNWAVQYDDDSYSYGSKLFEEAKAIYLTAYDSISKTYYEPLCLADKEAVQFSDVSTSHKNLAAILFLYSKGIVGGYSDGTFKPDKTINRAELLKILVEGIGLKPSVDEHNNCFPDVKNEWYAPYVCYAKTANWISGYPDGNFKPEKSINKVEALKMLLNSQGYIVTDEVSEKPFEDVKTSDWFVQYIDKAKSLGILEETGQYFFPKNEVTRAGVCENLYRLLTK